MATPVPVVGGSELEKSSNRWVWILNRDVEPYKAEFQGLDITIPPNMQKIAKHVRDGGNLMEYLAACKFVRDFKQPQKWVPTRGGGLEPIFGVKALLEHEMTEDEVETILGKTKTDLKKDAATEEKKARRDLKKSLDKIPGKVAAELEDE